MHRLIIVTCFAVTASAVYAQTPSTQSNAANQNDQNNPTATMRENTPQEAGQGSYNNTNNNQAYNNNQNQADEQ